MLVIGMHETFYKPALCQGLLMFVYCGFPLTFSWTVFGDGGTGLGNIFHSINF